MRNAAHKAEQDMLLYHTNATAVVRDVSLGLCGTVIFAGRKLQLTERYKLFSVN